MRLVSDWKILAGDDEHDDEHRHHQGAVIERTKPKIKKPPMYKVLLMNDDYTPMEFVVHLLVEFFNMSTERAHQIMMHVHTRGVGICGVYPREIAESKVQQVLDYASEHQHPLRCVMEKD